MSVGNITGRPLSKLFFTKSRWNGDPRGGGNWGRGRRHEENKECRRNLVRKRKRDKSRAVTAFRSQLDFAWFAAWRGKEKVTREQWRDVAVAEGTRADIEKDISHRSKPLQPSWLHASVTEANRVIYRSWEAAVYKNSYKNDKFTMRARGERGAVTWLGVRPFTTTRPQGRLPGQRGARERRRNDVFSPASTKQYDASRNRDRRDNRRGEASRRHTSCAAQRHIG